MIPQPIDQIPLFLRLSQEERGLVTARLKRRQASADEVIFAENQPSDAMFIITSGRVKLESAFNRNTLATLGSGSLLGEEDTLLGRPYSATARATLTTQLYSLSRNDIHDLISQQPSIGLKFGAVLGLRIAYLETYLVQQRLRNIELLTALSEDDLTAIAQNLDFRSVSRGDMILNAGEPGDAIFIIEEGQARLVSKSHEGDSFEELGEGALLGQDAMLTGKPYASSVRAVTDVSLWVLAHGVYQELIHDRPTIKLAFSRALAESLGSGDQNNAIERMRQLHLFSDMPTEALGALASHLVLRQFPAGEAIYIEGTPGDAMYIVDSGEVRLMESQYADAQLLERVRAGDSFGEMALLTGRTRAECCRAANDVTVWALYKSDFDDVMVQYPEISVSLSRALTQRLSSRESDFVIRHLRRITLFSNLGASELRQVSSRVHGLRFRPGEIVCFAGQPASMLFLIEVGEVKRTGMGPNGEPVTLDILGPGDSFGEQAIVQRMPYNTTIQALTEVELWTIEQDEFLAMMEQYPSLALTVTRMMADQLSRAQQFQQPRNQPPAPPRGSSPMPPRSTGGRPTTAPPPNRVQQPPSGARPIKPSVATPPTKKGVLSGTVVTGAAASTILTSVPKDAPKETLKPASTQHSGLHMPHIQAPHLQAPKLPHVQAPKLPHIDAPHLQAPKLPHIEASHLQAPKLPHIQAPHFQAPHMPHIQAPHLPHRQTPPAQPQPSAPAVRRPSFFSEFGTWASHLSIGARMRVLVGGLLVAWILLISMPIATVTTVSSAVAGLQISNSKGSDSGVQLIRSPSTGSGNNSKVAYAVATETPVPTRTPLPTMTPTPKPTSTPAPKVVPTKIPPTAVPAAAAPPAGPPLPARFIDPRLGTGPQVLPHLENVKVVPANVAHGQKFWYARSIKFENIDESSNDHTIYVKIFDESGKRTAANIRAWGENSGEYPAESIPQKSADDMCDCNYGVFMYGDGYGVQVVDQYPSDQVLGMVMPMRRHVNYKIQFQLVTNP